MVSPTNINVDINSLDQQICPECESLNCYEIFHLKLLPAMLSPNGKEQMLKLPVGYMCINCGASMFIPTNSSGKTESKSDIQIIPK